MVRLGHMARINLSVPSDAVAVFATLRDRLPAPVWLDGAAGGRYSIYSAGPQSLLVSRSGVTWRLSDDMAWCLGDEDPLSLLAAELGDAPTAEPPFTGGAIGYFSYELGRRLQGQSVADAGMPEMAVGIYDWAFVVDHQNDQAWLAGSPPAGIEDVLATTLVPKAMQWSAQGDSQARPDASGYSRAFNQVMDYLREGDCYQVNLARRFTAAFSGDPLAVYAEFRDLAGGPFSAYLDLPGGPILSGSPERFLAVRGGCVETRPIKGTRARDTKADVDQAVREALRSDPKDRAENLMIVDLLRNDLGRVCRTGSIQVPRLFDIETYATVHHMVSVVEGELADGRHATDLLRECLPGGSITGAPKYRAMEIIDELEGAPRGIYCGAVGYIGYDGAMDTSIAIRTMTARDGVLDYRAGGGLVFDSECAAEFAETEAKALAFRQLIQGRFYPHVAMQQDAAADIMQGRN